MTASAVLGAIDPSSDPARSLYIHVPFCFHKCHYCDFYSIVDTRGRQEPFTARLIRELAALAPSAGGLPLRTIFVGGGTPTLLRVDLWERVLKVLREAFGVGRDGHLEFTVECNPETATPELMACLRAGGVNRISIGAQSFEPRHLKTLERWHDPENVGRAIEMARAAGIERQSMDLIYAIPGQTLEEWRRDLERALAIGASHLSCYSLTYEANTAMTRRMERGEFIPADEDLDADMYEMTVALCRSAGLDRYEVSNYAKPGDEARHNLAYWRQEAWLAAGPSASAHVGGHRWKNVPRLDDYLKGDDEGFASIVDHEAPDAQRAARERIMMGLRIREGVPVSAVMPFADAAVMEMRVARWRESGRLIESDGFWRLSDAGFLIADLIAADLMGAVR